MENFRRCPGCGTRNISSRVFCSCGADLSQAEVESVPASTPVSSPKIDRETPYKRPGCLTVYAILVGGIGILMGLLFVGVGVVLLFAKDAAGKGPDAGSSIVFIVCGLFGAGVMYLLARGLWEMRTWARYLFLLQHALSLPGSISISLPLGALIMSGSYGVLILFIIFLIVAIGFALLNIYAVIWFAVNGKYFS